MGGENRTCPFFSQSTPTCSPSAISPFTAILLLRPTSISAHLLHDSLPTSTLLSTNVLLVSSRHQSPSLACISIIALILPSSVFFFSIYHSTKSSLSLFDCHPLIIFPPSLFLWSLASRFGVVLRCVEQEREVHCFPCVSGDSALCTCVWYAVFRFTIVSR